MSNAATIETNADEVYNKFIDLSMKEMRRTLRNAVTNAAGKLRTSTRSVFRSALPAAGRKSPRYSDKMTDAVRRSKVEETKSGEISVKVHIMGTRNSTSGTFRARFFEKGTSQRQTRRGYNRGRIKGLFYFQRANADFESNYTNTLNNYIEKAIEKINNSKA